MLYYVVECNRVFFSLSFIVLIESLFINIIVSFGLSGLAMYAEDLKPESKQLC